MGKGEAEGRAQKNLEELQANIPCPLTFISAFRVPSSTR